MKRDETVYLRHILDAIAKAQNYLLEVDEASFFTNSLVQDGVIRQIEIIGEATKRLSSELRQKYSGINEHSEQTYRRPHCYRKHRLVLRW